MVYEYFFQKYAKMERILWLPDVTTAYVQPQYSPPPVKVMLKIRGSDMETIFGNDRVSLANTDTICQNMGVRCVGEYP